MQMPSVWWCLGLGSVSTDVKFSLFLIAWYNINICGNWLPLAY